MGYIEQCDWCNKTIKQYSGQQLRDKGVAREEVICVECQKKKEKVVKFIQELPNKITNKVLQLQGQAEQMLKDAIAEIVREGGDEK